MADMKGLYRCLSLNREEMVVYGNGEVDFITTRKSYEATEFKPQYDALPWKERREELIPG